jgi:hypothetical protein
VTPDVVWPDDDIVVDVEIAGPRRPAGVELRAGWESVGESAVEDGLFDMLEGVGRMDPQARRAAGLATPRDVDPRWRLTQGRRGRPANIDFDPRDAAQPGMRRSGLRPAGWPEGVNVPSWWSDTLPWSGRVPHVVLPLLGDGPERELLFGLLAQWVERLVQVHDLPAAVVPPCWLEHPRVVEELYGGWLSYLDTTGSNAPGRQWTTFLADWANIDARLRAQAAADTARCVNARAHVGQGETDQVRLAQRRAAEVHAAKGFFTTGWLWPEPVNPETVDDATGGAGQDDTEVFGDGLDGLVG